MLGAVSVGFEMRTTPFFGGVAPTTNGRSLQQDRTINNVVKLRQQHSCAATTAAAGPKKHSNVSTVRRWAMTGPVLGNNAKQREGDVSAHAFGSSFEESYDVSEPRKVDESALGDPPAGNADVIEKMKQTFVKFKHEKFHKEPDLFEPLKGGQKPKVMIVACADSRVSPTMLYGLDPGEVFIVRNVANLVHPYEGDKETISGESAALLFAVTALGVSEIVVMGHRNCGGIKALLTFSPDDMKKNPIGRWISSAEPAKSQTLKNLQGKSFAEQCQYCELESVNKSLSNLLTFPFIKERFEKGELGIHGWYYDFVDGDLTTWKVKNPSLVTA